MHLHWNFTKNWQTLCAKRVCVCARLCGNKCIYVYASTMRIRMPHGRKFIITIAWSGLNAQDLVVYLVFRCSHPHRFSLLVNFFFSSLCIVYFNFHCVWLAVCMCVCVSVLCPLHYLYVRACVRAFTRMLRRCSRSIYELHHRLFQFLFIVGELLYTYIYIYNTKKMKTNLVFILFRWGIEWAIVNHAFGIGSCP